MRERPVCLSDPFLLIPARGEEREPAGRERKSDSEREREKTLKKTFTLHLFVPLFPLFEAKETPPRLRSSSLSFRIRLRHQIELFVRDAFR